MIGLFLPLGNRPQEYDALLPSGDFVVTSAAAGSPDEAAVHARGHVLVDPKEAPRPLLRPEPMEMRIFQNCEAIDSHNSHRQSFFYEFHALFPGMLTSDG